MFSEDFYPTPGAVAAKMLQKIDRNAVHFLEPSAGKGDLAKAILGFGRTRSPYDHGSRHRVDVIELHPDLLKILQAHEELTVVGYDWLTYDGVSYYDAIVMNPPFSKGALHLLRAWDFLHNGEIVCLLNQETIDNPYTEDRQRLHMARSNLLAPASSRRNGPPILRSPSSTLRRLRKMIASIFGIRPTANNLLTMTSAHLKRSPRFAIPLEICSTTTHNP